MDPHGRTSVIIRRRIVRRGIGGKVLFDETIDHHKPRSAYHHPLPEAIPCLVTEFYHIEVGLRADPPIAQLSKHQCRQLSQQAHECCAAARTAESCYRRLLVVEVLSPPRFAKISQQEGFRARSVDLVTGQDLTVPQTKREL